MRQKTYDRRKSAVIVSVGKKTMELLADIQIDHHKYAVMMNTETREILVFEYIGNLSTDYLKMPVEEGVVWKIYGILYGMMEQQL